MMKVRGKLKRSWSVEPSRERVYYRVEGLYHKVCEEDRSDNWTICYYDSLDVDQGVIVNVIQVDVLGQERHTKYSATSEGLVFVD